MLNGEERGIIINKLNNILEKFPEIESLLRKLRDFSDLRQVTEKYEPELEKLREKLNQYKIKFERDLLEVAIVGLEKSGKSSLINAILGGEHLPVGRERMTYTVTTICYGEKDKVTVKFYTKDEFNKEVLHPILKILEFKDYDNFSIDTLDENEVEEHLKRLKYDKENTYRAYEVTVISDLREILEGKKVILQHLNGVVRDFYISEFTRGLEDYKEYITHPHTSRAVKEVIFESPRFGEGLKNVIIYDLPGFDSPTELHSTFTKSKINSADAVVFVRKAKEPSIKQNEAKIISETVEEDGVMLKEKTFYFNNMVDELEDNNDYSHIRNKFLEELRKYKLYPEDERRIIYGSAKAHLESNKENEIFKKLRKVTLNEDTGVDRLLQNLRDYNANERAKFLHRKINKFILRIREILEDLENQIKTKQRALKEAAIEDHFIEKHNAFDLAKKIVDEELKNLDLEIKEKYLNNQFRDLSNKLYDKIQSFLNFDSLLDDQEIKRVEKSVMASTSTLEMRPNEFNIELRKVVKSKVFQEMLKIANDLIEIELSEIKRRIFHIFIEAYKVPEDKNEIFMAHCESEFHEKLGIKFTDLNLSVRTLVERFGTDVIDFLSNPLGSVDRKNKFNEIKRDLISLLAYSNDASLNKSLLGHPLLIKLLNPSYKEVYENTIVNTLQSRGVAIEQKSLLQLIKTVCDRLPDLKDLIGILNNPHIKTIEELIKSIELYNPKVDEEAFEVVLDMARSATTYEEVLNEIKSDIEVLRELFQCIVNAINLEKLLVNSIHNIILAIREGLENPELTKNLRKMLLDDYTILIERQYRKSASLADLRDKIREILDDLNSKSF